MHFSYFLCLAAADPRPAQRTVASNYELLAGGLLEGSTVDVPPLIAVTSASVGVKDDLRMVHLYSLILLMIYL
jgi:hypothetical protein